MFSVNGLFVLLASENLKSLERVGIEPTTGGWKADRVATCAPLKTRWTNYLFSGFLSIKFHPAADKSSFLAQSGFVMPDFFIAWWIFSAASLFAETVQSSLRDCAIRGCV